MGREIESLLLQRGHEVVLKIDIENTSDFNETNMKNADVAIEFTTPHTAFANVMKCLEWGVPVVCGTTGWNQRMEEAEKLCRKVDGTFFHSSNFSIGVNIFFRVSEYLARMMNREPGYCVSMTETHHTQKKDAPSGTAVMLAEGVLENIDRIGSWVNHETLDRNVLGILSLREGAVPGTHEVKYESEADIIEIRHEAKNRSGLVLGAVMAAEFTQGNKGILTMRDMLEF